MNTLSITELPQQTIYRLTFTGEIQPSFLMWLSTSCFEQVGLNVWEVPMQEVESLGIENTAFMCAMGQFADTCGQQVYKLEKV